VTGTAGAGESKRFGFIGVSTSQSAIMRVFPLWAQRLGLGDVVMRGHDLPLHADPQSYRRLVEGIKSDPDEVGALITSHKIDLFESCRDLFDYADDLAELCGEVSSLSKRGDRLCAHAKDPVSAGRSLEEFIGPGYWSASEADALLFGAGGANLAISLNLLTARPREDRPGRVVVVDRAPGRLASMRAIHDRLDCQVEILYVESSDPLENDRLLGSLAPGSLVVNGTGMGKDAPGSPITDGGIFPERGIVWELNYRGELDFLRQSRSQQGSRALVVQDGWRYFIHGWTCVMEEVFEQKMTAQLVSELAGIALAVGQDRDTGPKSYLAAASGGN
jgi:shikimate dehydrogenase